MVLKAAAEWQEFRIKRRAYHTFQHEEALIMYSDQWQQSKNYLDNTLTIFSSVQNRLAQVLNIKIEILVF